MKKVLSLVLVIAMVLSSMSFAFAGTFKDVTGNYEDAINTLAGLGVVTGYEDGTYKPERVVTRAEMAKLLVEILGYGDLVAGSKSNFTDTQGHWADAWIALAAGKGIVVGTGEGKFTPDRTVSYDEAITMVIRGLGYTDTSNELKNMTWPTNFKVKAAELDVLDGVKIASTGADRGGVAQLLYNALEAELVKVTSEGDVEGTDKLLLSRLAKEETYTIQPKHIDSEDKAYKGDIVDLEPYMYQNVTVYENKDKDVVYVKESNSLVLTGILNDAGDVTANQLVVEDADEDDNTFDITTSSAFMVNGVVTDIAKLAVGNADIKVTVVLDAEADDKLVDGLDVVGVVAEKATREVQITAEYKAGRTKFSGITLPVDSDNDVVLDKVTVEGAVDSLEDIAEDSIVTLYEGYNSSNSNPLKEIRLVVATDTVEGKITKVNHDKSVVTVDGKAYDASAFADKSNIAVGNTGILFLNANGEYYKLGDVESATKDYAVVVSSANGVYDAFLKGYDKYAKVKLATADDEEIVYELADEAVITDGITETVIDKTNVHQVNTNTLVPANRLVEFELDKDGRVESIEYVVYDRTNASLDVESKSFILADNAVIFDADNTPVNADLYQVLTVKQLDTDANITAHVVYNADGEIEVLFVTAGVEAESTGTYAVINNVEVTSNNDGKTVYVITAFVDGQKVSYLTNRTFYTNNSNATALRTALRGGYQLSEFTMDGDVITNVTTKAAVEGKVVSVKAANDVFTIIKSDNTKQTVVLADEAIVYLQTATATVEVTDLYDLDADDVNVYTDAEGDTVKIYDTDNDGEYDIVIIKDR